MNESFKCVEGTFNALTPNPSPGNDVLLGKRVDSPGEGKLKKTPFELFKEINIFNFD